MVIKDAPVAGVVEDIAAGRVGLAVADLVGQVVVGPEADSFPDDGAYVPA